MMKEVRLLLILCGLFCGTAVAQPRLSTPPNMIVILADDLGYGDLGCTGSKQIKTPSLDRLAREGVFCSRAYVTAPMCSPSRMGLLTGRFPKRYGITTNPNIQMDYLPESHYGLPQTEKLIPEYLNAAAAAEIRPPRFKYSSFSGISAAQRSASSSILFLISSQLCPA